MFFWIKIILTSYIKYQILNKPINEKQKKSIAKLKRKTVT